MVVVKYDLGGHMGQYEKPQNRRYRVNSKKMVTTLLTLAAMVAIIIVAAVALNKAGAIAAGTQPSVSIPAGTVQPASTPGASSGSATAKPGSHLILVDAGHGGFDPGAIGITGVHEADLNLAVAFCLKAELEKNGMQVIMTRERDEGLGTTQNESLAARGEIINQCGSDIVISIHMNSFPDDPSVSGPMVLFMPGSDKGKTLAETVQQSLNDALGVDDSSRSEDLYVLRSGNQPCVLVECGFLSNEDEEHSLQQPDYQQKIAKAICEGIVQYFSQQ